MASQACWSPRRQRSIRTSALGRDRLCGLGRGRDILKQVTAYSHRFSGVKRATGRIRCLDCDWIRLRRRPAAPATAFPSPTSSPRVGTPVYVYSAGADPRGLRARSTGAFAGYPARDALRAEGQLDARHRCACSAGLARSADANSGGEIDVALRAGFAPGARSSSPASARRATNSTAPSALGAEGHQRRVGRRSRAHRRDRARRAAPGRASRCASTPTSTPTRTPTSPPACASTSSACRSSTRRRCSARSRRGPASSPSASTCTSDRRSSTSTRSGARPRAAGRPARRVRAAGIVARAPRPGRRPRHRLRRRRGRRPGGVRRGRAAGDPRDAAAPVSSPAAYLVAPAGVLVGTRGRHEGVPGSPRFVVLDAGMTELIRPMLYGAFHRIDAGDAAARADERRAKSSGRCARRATRSGTTGGSGRSRSATSSPSSTPAPTGS